MYIDIEQRNKISKGINYSEINLEEGKSRQPKHITEMNFRKPKYTESAPVMELKV